MTTMFLNPAAKSCYDVAKLRGITPQEAASQMLSEGWQFEGYDEYGEQAYLPPLNLVNLTPHAINICDDSGAIIRTIPASGQQARCAVSTSPRFEIGNLKFVSTVFGAVTGLPEPQTDTMYIVSLLVKQAVSHRADVCSPGEMVRDTDGEIIGCKNFNI